MTPLDSWLLILFFFGIMVILTLLFDGFVHWVNKVAKRYWYARGYAASRIMACKIALRRR